MFASPLLWWNTEGSRELLDIRPVRAQAMPAQKPPAVPNLQEGERRCSVDPEPEPPCSRS